MKKTAHIISHSHWDREWYLPYEKHHMLLIELMDTLVEKFESDPEFKHYHLDGQTIILEDYFQVRPEKRAQVTKYIQEGKLHIGPWYVLQDEFLTSSEANVRNLLVGHQDAAEYGKISKLGYFPDSFGNMGQAPQMLKQAGIDTAVFGRGVKPTGFNNVVTDSDSFESPYSEMMWESPDGSKVVGILFANWYSNGNEVPEDIEEAKVFWEQKLTDVSKYVSTNQLLFMNGCDHQPIQTNIGSAIETAKALHEDVEFVHSNFNEYIEALKAELTKDLTTIKGELRSQQTEGWYTLVNTASARVYLKQWNQLCQTLLEKVAEPLATMAYDNGNSYPHHLFTYAWKTLMQNHPHDSICGCSVDDVHREMVTRFEKAKNVGEHIVKESISHLTKEMNTSSLEGIPFVVFNTTGWERSGVVTVEVDIDKKYFREGYPDVLAKALREVPFPTFKVVDAEGNNVLATVTDMDVVFNYDLPKDKFRQPYMARKARVELEVKDIPMFGWKTFSLVEIEKKKTNIGSLVMGENTFENDNVVVTIQDNGSLTIVDKHTEKVFTDLCVYENTGDIGNEYVYKQPNGEVALTTENLSAHIEVLEDTPYKAVVGITHEWDLPVGADERLTGEVNDVIEFRQRHAQRVEETVTMKIQTYVTLEKGSKGVKIKTTFNNEAKDHRIRALFPSDIEANVHHVDSIFEVAVRENEPSEEWTNPSNCQHQHAFVNVHNESAGLTIANKGLNEYEVLRDGRNTIAITLLRAVGELGDWGVFHTPEAQCLGEQSVEFEIISHGSSVYESYQEAYQFQVPFVSEQVAIQDGTLPTTYSFMEWSGEKIAHSTLKVCKESGDIMSRWFNLSREETVLETKIVDKKLYKSTILEEATNEIVRGCVSLTPAEIITLGMCK